MPNFFLRQRTFEENDCLNLDVDSTSRNSWNCRPESLNAPFDPREYHRALDKLSSPRDYCSGESRRKDSPRTQVETQRA